MKKELKVYIAGKRHQAAFSRDDWRDQLCEEVTARTGISLRNLDPFESDPAHPLDEGDLDLIFGRECFMIKKADLVIVYLSDDISVGGSQEMLIAKHYRKPLIGIAPRGGVFNKDLVIDGTLYRHRKHPFVHATCDYLAEDVSGVASCLEALLASGRVPLGIDLIDDAVMRYARTFFPHDRMLADLGAPRFPRIAHKALVLDRERARILAVRYRDEADVDAQVRGRLGLPGGKVEDDAGRPRRVTARVREETGIAMMPQIPFASWGWSYARDNVSYEIAATAYLASYEGGAIRAPHKGSEIDLEKACWVRLEDVDPGRFIEDERPVIEKFLRYASANPFALAR